MKTGDTPVAANVDGGSNALFEDLFGDLLDEDAPFIPTESASNTRTLSFADEPFLTGSAKRTVDGADAATEDLPAKANVLPFALPAWLAIDDSNAAGTNASSSHVTPPASMLDALSDSALTRALARVLVQRGLVTEQEIVDEARALQHESKANLK